MRFLFSFLRFPVLVGICASLVSCSLFRERTVQDIIDDLPKYDADTPIYWYSYHMHNIPNCEQIKTMGDLKKALENGLDPNLNDNTDTYIEDFFSQESFEERESRLMAIELLLQAGANPQRLSSFPLVYEKEYALHIKYGLDARKPVLYGFYEEFPLTRTDHTITAPIAEWLLSHGADPNQHALGRGFKHLTPLTNLDYIPRWSMFDNPIGMLPLSRPKEEVEKTRKVLIKYGARK